MKSQNIFLTSIFMASIILTGCGDQSAEKPNRNPVKTKPNKTRSVNPMNPYSSNPMNPLTNPTNKLIKTVKGLSSPKDSIVFQLSLLKAGNVEKLKQCFTTRQQKNITDESVAIGSKEIGTFEEIYASEKMGEYGGKKTCKIKMKNGRTLTTLVLTDGKWLSDTVWFK